MMIVKTEREKHVRESIMIRRPHHRRHRSKRSSTRIIHVSLRSAITIPSTKTNITVIFSLFLLNKWYNKYSQAEHKTNPKSTTDNFEYLSKSTTYSNVRNTFRPSKPSQVNRSEVILAQHEDNKIPCVYFL